jgi:rubrerythrin
MCREVEMMLSEVYLNFSTIKDIDREVKDVFLKLADDEKQHAILLEFVDKIITKSNLEITENETIKKVEHMHEKAKAVLHRSKQPIGINDALTFAIKLERYFIDVHARVLVSLADKQTERLVQTLAHDEDEHVASLCKCAEKYGVVV